MASWLPWVFELGRPQGRRPRRVLARREVFERLGLGLNRGLLLYGPPGTGKTRLSTALGIRACLAVCADTAFSP